MTGLVKILAAGALGSLLWAAESFTESQLKARFHFDLGPEELDVSSYPKERQADYLVFRRVCSQCHTPARPLNSGIVKREDWRRFVRRMHLRSESRPGTKITKEEARAVVDFLVYDSQRRKVERKAEFESQDQELRRLFEEVQKERLRRKAEEDAAKSRPAPPYTGVK